MPGQKSVPYVEELKKQQNTFTKQSKTQQGTTIVSFIVEYNIANK